MRDDIGRIGLKSSAGVACGWPAKAGARRCQSTSSIADFCIFAIAHNDIICACVAIALAASNYAIARQSRADANIILRTHAMTVARQMP